MIDDIKDELIAKLNCKGCEYFIEEKCYHLRREENNKLRLEQGEKIRTTSSIKSNITYWDEHQYEMYVCENYLMRPKTRL